MYDLTAAHMTLPLGTLVRVTNLRNHRSVIVRINDRGPYVSGRIVDLSYNAARVLHFEQQGLQRVRLDVLPRHSDATTIAMLREPALK
jgi:rare lipoprotein A